MHLDTLFLHFLIFILGASIASFISVYVERGTQDKFFSLKNKSICTKCLRKLNFFELVPIFSFLFLKGKCRTCKTKIPSKLFFGEIILGTWFLVSFLHLFPFPKGGVEFILVCIFGSLFFLLVLEDINDMEVTSKFIYILLILGISNTIIKFFYTNNIYDLFLPILIFSPIWFIYIINKNWMGEADPYIFTAIGLFFGTQFSISVFLYSIWFGAAYGIFYLYFINKKFERNIPVPFLPIIFFSTLFILIFNYHIIQISDILLIYESFYLS